VQLVGEIRGQTAYLVERQAELESLIDQDLKPKLEFGFAELRNDIS
jgi:hypothetical protein